MHIMEQQSGMTLDWYYQYMINTTMLPDYAIEQIMVADQVRDYLESGTVHNSVNFPEVAMPRSGRPRLAIVNANVPHMIERISKAISGAGINIQDMLNKSRGDVACTLLDTAAPVSAEVVAQIADIQGVLSVRTL